MDKKSGLSNEADVMLTKLESMHNEHIRNVAKKRKKSDERHAKETLIAATVISIPMIVIIFWLMWVVLKNL